jgi:N-acetylglucosaminyl-diphospho-decaprenol L-rhamnosyltransferase
MDLSIIIVNYNTRQLTLECLRSVFEQTLDINYEVIVVDNASSDDSAGAIARNFPQVKLIASKENHGFARANNLAAQNTKGDYLLLLNPDTVVLKRAIEKLLSFAIAHPEAGICGSRTVFPDGSVNPKCCFGESTAWSLFCRALGLSRIFKISTLFNPESYGSWAYDTVRQVDIITGCFFMVKRDLWEQLAGFNPVFFMYGEEVDFCLRARKLGYKPLFTPDAEIIHYGETSEPVKEERIYKVLCAQSTVIREHWPEYKRWWGLAMLLTWVRMKSFVFAVLGMVNSEHFNSQAIVWNSLWKRRKEWLKGWEVARQP